MPYTPPTVNYNSGSNSTWYSLTGVQSVNISRGRQRFQDPVSQSSMVVELIPANSYTLALAIGQPIDVRDTNDTSSVCYFQGRITDIQRSYAFPYNSGSGAAPADRIRITATGATGIVGAVQLADYAMSAGNTWGTISSLVTAAQGINWVDSFSNNLVENSAQTYSGAALDAVNQLLRTSQTTIDDVVVTRSSAQQFAISTWATGSALNSVAFSDTGSNYAYTGLEFLSSVQNTFNWVEVEATGVDTVVATSGSAPYNSLKYSTFNATVADATSLATYLVNMLSGQVAPAPYAISTSTVASASCMTLAQLAKDSGVGLTTTNVIMGQQVAVTFRGSTTYGSVVGVNAAFYPDRGNVQLYLSPSLGTPFTLDSSTFGVLDTNRLGYP
jgi:hypothetical protein